MWKGYGIVKCFSHGNETVSYRITYYNSLNGKTIGLIAPTVDEVEEKAAEFERTHNLKYWFRIISHFTYGVSMKTPQGRVVLRREQQDDGQWVCCNYPLPDDTLKPFKGRTVEEVCLRIADARDAYYAEHPEFLVQCSSWIVERHKKDLLENVKPEKREYVNVLMVYAIFGNAAEREEARKELYHIFGVSNHFKRQDRIIGQDEELKTLCFLVMQQVEKACYGLNVPSPSCLLTAPSGSGKSEFYKTVHDFFREHNVPIPVIRCDLSQVTETGFKGKEISSLIKQIQDASFEKYGHAAICFLDEADKRMVPSYGINGTNYNSAMQANMLSMVEGSEMDNGDDEMFDTSNTMFILMGAFQSIRDEKRDYGEMLDDIYADEDGSGQESDKQFYNDITLPEIVQYGMIDELAGRLRMVINFHKLPESAMRSVILQKCEMLGAQMHCQVMMTEEAIADFLKIFYTNLGVRHPMNKLAELMTRKLSACTINGSFDPDKEMLVIESMEQITVRPINETDDMELSA